MLPQLGELFVAELTKKEIEKCQRSMVRGNIDSHDRAPLRQVSRDRASQATRGASFDEQVATVFRSVRGRESPFTTTSPRLGEGDRRADEGGVRAADAASRPMVIVRRSANT